MWAQAILFGGVTLAVAVVCWRRGDAASRATAYILSGVWIACVAVKALFGPAVESMGGAYLDAFACIAFTCVWTWTSKRWVLILTALFMAQETNYLVHAMHQTEMSSAEPLRVWTEVVHPREVWRDWLYAAQLIAACIGPYIGEWIVAIRRSLAGGRTRSRRRAVVATADAFVCRIGARALREKSE